MDKNAQDLLCRKRHAARIHIQQQHAQAGRRKKRKARGRAHPHILHLVFSFIPFLLLRTQKEMSRLLAEAGQIRKNTQAWPVDAFLPSFFAAQEFGAQTSAAGLLAPGAEMLQSARLLKQCSMAYARTYPQSQ